MIPTPYLRFVERGNPNWKWLQQWWSKDINCIGEQSAWNWNVPETGAGEWRDVPMEKDDAPNS